MEMCSHKSPPLVHILSHVNQIHTYWNFQHLLIESLMIWNLDCRVQQSAPYGIEIEDLYECKN